MARRLWTATVVALGLWAGPANSNAQTVGRPAVDVGPILPPPAPAFVPAAATPAPTPIVPPPPTAADALPGLLVSGPATPVARQPGPPAPVSVTVSTFSDRSDPAGTPRPLPSGPALPLDVLLHGPLNPVPVVTVPAGQPTPIVMSPATVSTPAAPPAELPMPGTTVGSTPTLPAPAPVGSSTAPGKADAGSSAPSSGGKGENGGAAKSGGEKGEKSLTDSLHQDDCYGFKSLFDSLHPQDRKRKAWYEKLSFRGYTQFRWGRSLYQDDDSAEPSLFNDRFINGTAENFYIRRARLTLSGDVSDHLFLYFQTDSAVTPPGTSTVSYFTQIRDLYGDVYCDKDKVHRVRVGISKVPFGWENLQSSQNRLPLERTNPINSAAPNERDLGVFYYWTPEEQQKLFKDLVDGGLRGSGNYGVFGFGVYNGQSLPNLEQNHNLHAVARVTWPFRLPDGQVVEAGLQGYTGQFVVAGDEIAPLGTGAETTPAGTRDDGHRGHLDQRVAGSFVWYPQPFGFQAEWCAGRGPGLNDAQTAVVRRSLHGGYVMAMYKMDTPCHGIITPYARCQYYRGGYKSVANAPYGTHRELDLGVEWQIRQEMELTVEYAMVDGVGFNPSGDAGIRPYDNFDGGVLRVQFQINY